MSLLRTTYKMLSINHLLVLTSIVEVVIGHYQCGFRRDRSSTDQNIPPPSDTGVEV